MNADTHRCSHRAAIALVLTATFFALACAASAQENWPQFRGPGARGVADGANLPDAWSTTDNVAWQTEIPGRGWSSPVVWGDKVFLTTAIKEEGDLEVIKEGLYFGGERETPTEPHTWKVYCLDARTGDILWERTAKADVPKFGHHLKNTLASETPVTDGERLYAYFGNVGLFCYDLDGNELWQKDLGSFPIRHGWGTAASPVLHGDRIYVVHDNDQQSFLVALDKRTGDEIWRVEREEGSNWSTPFIWQNEERTEIVTPGTDKTRSYDLEGNLLWELGGASSITIATPFAAHDLLYLSSGYILDPRKPIWAIRPGASGDISLDDESTTNDAIAWCQKKAAPYNPTTLCYKDHIYVLYDRGTFACYDAHTGEEVYAKQRIHKDAHNFTASPWAYDGKVFCLSEDGDTFVIQAGDEFKLLAQNPLEEFSMATPAIAADRLFIRTETQLYCIENESGTEEKTAATTANP